MQQQLAGQIEEQMPGVAEAGVSVKYGKKLLGKLQRAPAAAAALTAASASACQVLAPGFDEAMAAQEAAERRANPAAALPDDLFSDEPPAAARQPCAAERRAAEAEFDLEAALCEARSLRAFLRESELEWAEEALAALQRRRRGREAEQAAAAAAAAYASAAPNGLAQLAQLPQVPGAAQHAQHAHHDGLNPENECVICMADLRRVMCVPCGHVCLCARCMPVVQADGKCPLCRMHLADLLQIF